MGIPAHNLRLHGFPVRPVIWHNDSRTMLRRVLHKFIEPTRLQALISQDQIVTLHSGRFLPVVIVTRNTIESIRPQQQMPAIPHHGLLLPVRRRQVDLRHFIDRRQKLRQSLQRFTTILRHTRFHVRPNREPVIQHLVHPLGLQLATDPGERRWNARGITESLFGGMKKLINLPSHSAKIIAGVTRDAVELGELHLHPIPVRKLHRLLQRRGNRFALIIGQLIIRAFPNEAALRQLDILQLRPF